MIAMILAAGRGERLRPLTDELPKALVEVNGESLLERHLKALGERGVDTVVINLGWLGEQIVERVGSGSRFGLNVIYSPEYDNVLDTGGGIHRALPLLGSEPFWVINADTYTDFRLPETRLDSDMLGHLILVPTPADRNNVDFELQDGIIRNAKSPALTFSGFALYRRELFMDQKPGRFPITPILRRAADNGKLSGSLYEGLWEDVGTAERLERLNRR
ncbi:MAG: nucleotidyltransferase family protein [Woeseia sp.]